MRPFCIQDTLSSCLVECAREQRYLVYNVPLQTFNNISSTSGVDSRPRFIYPDAFRVFFEETKARAQNRVLVRVRLGGKTKVNSRLD